VLFHIDVHVSAFFGATVAHRLLPCPFFVAAIADPGLEHCIVANVPCHIDSVFALIWTTVAHVLTWSVAALRFVGAAPRKLPLVLDGCCLCFGRRNIVLEHKIFVTVACNGQSVTCNFRAAVTLKRNVLYHSHQCGKVGKPSRSSGRARGEKPRPPARTRLSPLQPDRTAF